MKDGNVIYSSEVTNIDSIIFVPPMLSVEPSALSFTAAATESYDVVVTTNQQPWNATSNQTWCTITKGTNQFTVKASANTGAIRTATITVTAGNAPNVTITVTQASGYPNIAFVARNPILEYLYNNRGFFEGMRINFDLVVYDAMGMTSITISEEATGAPNGNYKKFTQTRVIPISGPGTYPLSQEIKSSSTYDIGSLFTYTVSAYGESYTRNYSGSYSSYDGSWSHYFVIK